MSGSIAHIMSMGTESLMNSRMGVDVTGHNIANAHTDGYSRQRVNVGSRDPARFGNHTLGQGATVKSIERVHDKFLESQFRKESRTVTERETAESGLQRIENLFNPDLTSTLRDRMNNFFNGLRELASYPEEPAVRTHVMEMGTNLAQTFQGNHSDIVTCQKDINAEITAEVELFNKRLEELANINQRILELSNGPNQAGDLLDQRDKIISEITKTIDCKAYENERGMMVIRGPGGSLILEGVHYGKLETDPPSDNVHANLYFRDYSGSVSNITEKTKGGGKIGQLFVNRDVYAQKIRDELNVLAKEFGDAFNKVHRLGYGGRDYEAKNGRDFFEGLDMQNVEYAQQIRVADHITADPFSIGCAMTAEAPGDNAILIELVKLQNTPILDGGNSTFQAVYDRFIGHLGNEMSRAKEEKNAAGVVASQLKGQKETISGVSLDEEAANLVKYQHLFAASSRVITTADELMKTVLELKR
jgi:flagellar hook-associated protein 1 FlgK